MSQDSSITPPRVNLRYVPLLILNHDEQVSLDRYPCRKAIKLPGTFLSRPWGTFLFQKSSAEPAVMLAMLARSSAHEVKIIDATDQRSQHAGYQKLLTLQQYSKAIRGLQLYLVERTHASICVALITCVIFVHLEILHENYKPGINHFQHGFSFITREPIPCQQQ